jgi:hypothetical protein
MIFIFTSNFAVSQPFSKISFGLQGGYNLSLYDIEYSGISVSSGVSSSDSYGRFNGGIFLESFIINDFGLRLEAEYIYKGGVVKSHIISSSGLTPIDREYESELQYFSFNLLPFYAKDLSEGIGPAFYTGTYVSFLTKAKEFTTQKTYPPFNLEELKSERDIKKDLSGMDAGLIFGGAVNIKSFSIGARYYLGLTNIIKESAIVNAEAKNRIISFITSYKF